MVKKAKTGRGGPGRRQGRKPLEEGVPTIPVTIRMTATQKDKLGRLGEALGDTGAQWVRDRIDKAREPQD